MKEPQTEVKKPRFVKELTLEEKAKKFDSSKKFINSLGDLLYHGTLEKFDKFDISRVGTNTEYDNAKWGIFFSDDISRSKDFVEETRPSGDDRGVQIIKSFVDIKNPLDLTLNGILTNKKQAPIIYESFTGEKIIR